MRGKLIIFSAPSGAGKTTIEKEVLRQVPSLKFSISATSREKRPGEQEGVDYYYLSADEFREKIANNEFLEWEEVYPNHFYGTLLSEVDRIWAEGNHVLFDVDVKGGLNIKQKYPEQTLSIFIDVPSLGELQKRLENRSTETPEKIALRISKAKEELTYAKHYDVVILNDQLETAVAEANAVVLDFLESEV